MVRDTGRGSTESVQLPRGREQQGRLPGGGYICVDSNHGLAEGRQMRGPGGRRAGGMMGQERTGGLGS